MEVQSLTSSGPHMVPPPQNKILWHCVCGDYTQLKHTHGLGQDVIRVCDCGRH